MAGPFLESTEWTSGIEMQLRRLTVLVLYAGGVLV